MLVGCHLILLSIWYVHDLTYQRTRIYYLIYHFSDISVVFDLILSRTHFRRTLHRGQVRADSGKPYKCIVLVIQHSYFSPPFYSAYSFSEILLYKGCAVSMNLHSVIILGRVLLVCIIAQKFVMPTALYVAVRNLESWQKAKTPAKTR